MPTQTDQTVSVTDQIYKTIRENNDNLQKYSQLFKMANFGKMLGGTLHTFNNILGGILGYAQLMKYELPENSDASRQATVIESAAKRASQLISQLQHFSQRSKYRRVQIDPAVLIEQVVGILESAIKKNISLRTNFDHGQTKVHVDASSMCHVLLNLAFNASDAMPDGGELFFSTRLANCEVRDGQEPLDPRLHIIVRDTGLGIPQPSLSQVFDAFFTTKEDVFAPGMGLTIAKGIVEDQYGSIRVASEIGDGTAFTISLPIAQAQLRSAEISTIADDKMKAGQGQLIMVVDDEADLRNMTKRILEKRGYRVLLAESGTAAIEIFHAHLDEIDLVLLDMIMPGIDGIQVYEKLRQIKSDIKVILMSGYLNNPPFQGILDTGQETFIRKPWDLSELLGQTQKVLAQ